MSLHPTENHLWGGLGELQCVVAYDAGAAWYSGEGIKTHGGAGGVVV